MAALLASELIEIWERGQGQKPARQALLLLSAAYPDAPPQALAQLSVGQRDACLLALREQTFGSRLQSLVYCPACGERLDVQLDVSDLRVTPPPPSLSAPVEGEKEAQALSLQVGGYRLCARLPNGPDLADLSEDERTSADPGLARSALLERCLLSIEGENGGSRLSPAELPDEVVRQVLERLAEADPQADVTLALDCPVCRHEWQALFDIVTFFWLEIDAWVQRTLRQVHALASAYGWSEADILAFSPRRRQIYLDMVAP